MNPSAEAVVAEVSADRAEAVAAIAPMDMANARGPVGRNKVQATGLVGTNPVVTGPGMTDLEATGLLKGKGLPAAVPSWNVPTGPAPKIPPKVRRAACRSSSLLSFSVYGSGCR